MTFEDPKNYSVTSHDIISEIMDLDYRIPQAERFAAEMQAQKVTAVPVDEAPAADFVTADKAAFFSFLRACGVRGVLYRYAYYTASDVDRFYDLQDADKAFFSSHVYAESAHEPGKVFYSRRTGSQAGDAHTDYEDYLLYCKYMRLALDLGCPKRMEIYALHEGKVLCCVLEDLWMERLQLPNAAMIKAQCVNTGTVRGSVGQISFRFTYIPESEFAGEEPQPAAGDAAPEQPAKAPAKKQPARKPAAGKRTAPKKK
jgi:hypothetical protein